MIGFDDYWQDRRFRRKKAVMSGSTVLRYGDNIYHRDGGEEFLQEDSFHSLEDGSLSLGDLHRDTGTTDRVLISRYRNTLRVLHPSSYHYYDTLREKLRWGERL